MMVVIYRKTTYNLQVDAHQSILNQAFLARYYIIHVTTITTVLIEIEGTRNGLHYSISLSRAGSCLFHPTSGTIRRGTVGAKAQIGMVNCGPPILTPLLGSLRLYHFVFGSTSTAEGGKRVVVRKYQSAQVRCNVRKYSVFIPRSL